MSNENGVTKYFVMFVEVDQHLQNPPRLYKVNLDTGERTSVHKKLGFGTDGVVLKNEVDSLSVACS